MVNVRRSFLLLAMVSIIFCLLTSTISIAEVANVGDTRQLSGSYSVPQWSVDDTWGYKFPQYSYSSYYYGIGFKVVGSETINGNDCYKVKIWWDLNYGEEENPYGSGYDIEIPGYEYSFQYVGYAYFTKDKLAIAKFTMTLKMMLKFDGSEFSDLADMYGYTRMQDYYTDYEVTETDYTEIMENVEDWKFDMSYSFECSFVYDPPFVMYDYPLELNKAWDSTSTVTQSWKYKATVNMNDDMKDDMEDLYGDLGENYNPFDAVDEEESGSTEYTLAGSFEVVGEDIVTTDTGTFSVFEIDFDIEMSGYYSSGYRSRYGEDISYDSLALPGDTATLSLVGGTDGQGTSYLDPEKGYPQKFESGEYYSTTTYETVEPSSVENSYDNLAEPSNFGSGDENDNLLLIIIAIIAIVVIVVIVLVVFLMRRSKKRRQQYYGYGGQGQQQYPPGQPASQPQPQEQYPRDQPRDDYYRDQQQPPPPRDDYNRDRPLDDYNRDRPRDDYNRDRPRDDYQRN